LVSEQPRQQCAEKHVAADSGKAVDVEEFHFLLLVALSEAKGLSQFVRCFAALSMTSFRQLTTQIVSESSEGIQEPLHIVVIAEQVKHHQVFLWLREHDPTLSANPKLVNAATVNLT
jgi:hypothetical protein